MVSQRNDLHIDVVFDDRAAALAGTVGAVSSTESIHASIRSGSPASQVPWPMALLMPIGPARRGNEVAAAGAGGAAPGIGAVAAPGAAA